jgi:hypothetical protein
VHDSSIIGLADSLRGIKEIDKNTESFLRVMTFEDVLRVDAMNRYVSSSPTFACQKRSQEVLGDKLKVLEGANSGTVNEMTASRVERRR